MANPHPAYAAIDGQQINGYTVQITQIIGDTVIGELTRQGRDPLGFTIRVDADQFNVPAVRSEMLDEFSEFIQQVGQAPSGSSNSRLKLLWKT
jgi:hypothetical protein